MNIVAKIFKFLLSKEKKEAYKVFGMILIMALLDMLGVASIMPFVAVISNPEIIETNKILNITYIHMNEYGINSKNKFIFVLGVLTFLVLILSLTFKALTVFFQTRFSLMREYTIGHRLLSVYLNKPYSWFITRNSADLSKNVLSEVNIVISDVLIPFMNITAQSCVSIAILLLLLFIDPFLAISVATILIFSYGLVFYFTKNFLEKIGKQRTLVNRKRYETINEAFGASKEIKLGGLEHVYASRFSLPAETYAKNLAAANLIGQLPRFALELITFGGMLLVILYLMLQNSAFTNILPLLSLYVLAGYRLMPSMQGIYRSATQLKFAISALDGLLKELDNKKSFQKKSLIKSFELKKKIELNNVTYNYPKSKKRAIENINLSIKAQTRVGFVGQTGSGKTTTVDLLLGLLQPTSGTLKIDGKILNTLNLKKWQSIIGYVPQQIYLADDTLAANIAFGIAPENINMQKVEEAAKSAELHHFVLKNLPKKYLTIIGERGVRLSGGQKQRIGIARALYLEPKVLVLDEATSSLDTVTESAVIKSLKNIDNDLTIIMIAHRLSTIIECDQIYFFEDGKLISQGTYNELLKQNINFRAMHKQY